MASSRGSASRVAEGDRLVGHVAAREHERLDTELGEVGQQEVMQRRVRQHHAELRDAGATASATGAPGRLGASTIGRATRDEQRPLDVAELDELAAPSPRRAP